MEKTIPFAIEVRASEKKIILTGDLEPTVEVRNQCIKALQGISAASPDWSIDASMARLPSGGVEMWIELVRDHLLQSGLTYHPSQLSLCLQFDDEYAHPKTTFEDDYRK